MRTIVISLALTVFAAAAWTQQGAPEAVKTYSSASDVTALQAKAKSDRKGDAPLVVERILQLPPYNANLEYRATVGPASIHEKEAEFFYVIDGSATMVTGGKLQNEKRTNADNLTGSGIEGGSSRNVGKGDFIVVPENTPHWFSSINGSITLMSLHAPRTGGGTH
ncbi:MAG TPA: cupin domain-containing protein [Bryobacteraceae bacterium]|nr:cupin domain-containing protein [Bryobacteraceae bacterium]